MLEYSHENDNSDGLILMTNQSLESQNIILIHLIYVIINKNGLIYFINLCLLILNY